MEDESTSNTKYETVNYIIQRLLMESLKIRKERGNLKTSTEERRIIQLLKVKQKIGPIMVDKIQHRKLKIKYRIRL